MASISTDKQGLRRILFADSNGKRRSIRLGKLPIKTARIVKTHIEALTAAAIGKHSPDPETSDWVGKLDNVLYEKLAAVGLVPPRKPTSITTVSEFLKEYEARRIDVKPATREVWRQVELNLRDCFGEQRDLKTIDEPSAEDFKLVSTKEKTIIDYNFQAVTIRQAVLQNGG